MTKKQTKASPYTILLAEDNEVNLFYLRSIIAQHFSNIHVVEAQNGLLAVSQYKKYTPDLILIDLNMPVMRGDDAIKEIRKLAEVTRHHPKVILLTAAAFLDEDDLGVSIDAYILKPFKAEALMALVNSHIPSLKQVPVSNKLSSDRPQGKSQEALFDYDKLFRALASNQELVVEVLIYTVDYLEQFPDKFTAQLLTKDLKLIHQSAHELRGVAANAYLSYLTDFANQVEQKKAFDGDFLERQLQQIRWEIAKVLPLLRDHLAI